MNFTVIGAGAIGGVVGAYLSKSGHEATLVDINQEHIKAIKDHGLTIETKEGSLNVNVKAMTVNELLDSSQILDVVILAVKAQHTEQAVNQIQSLLNENSIVISMQNGLTEDVISNIIGKGRTIGSFVNLFADYIQPGLIQYGGVGSLYIGELDGEITNRIQSIQEKLKAWGDAKVTSNIYGYLWSKLAYGAILTATATVDETMANLLDDKENRVLFVDIATEVLKVADKLDIKVEGFDDWEPQVVFNSNSKRNWDEVNKHFDHLVSRLRTYKKVKSGIWRDLAVRKRKTEVPFHLGPVINKGHELGIDMKLNKKLLEMIKELEEGKRMMTQENLEELKLINNKNS